MSRGQKVAVEIKRIRAALAEQGDRLQKLPRQAVWLIQHTQNGQTYRLTYQPAPLNAWSLHPPDSAASRLLGVIDRALNPVPAPRADAPATQYQQQLRPWCVVQPLPEMRNRVIARFRHRNDADAHLKALRRLEPQVTYHVIFIPPLATQQLEEAQPIGPQAEV